MKSFISLNRKFMDFSPKELVELIKYNSLYIEGVEISINYFDDFERKYLENLALECSKNNLIFQVHGNSGLDMNTQIEYMKFLENISNQLGYKINVVLHPFTSEDHNKCINDTITYTNELIENIDNNKITISLENLNDTNYLEDRLNKEEITPIVANNELLFMTYDIGHEIIDYGKITDLNENLIPLISNVHIHTFNNDYDQGYDHKPILKGDEHWNQVLKGIAFLRLNNYQGPVVFEYDLYANKGNNKEEQIISYCKSIDYVSEHFK